MKTKRIFLLFLAGILLLSSCRNGRTQTAATPFDYQSFKDSLLYRQGDTTGDNLTSNVFDNSNFNPATDSLEPLLVKTDSFLHGQLDTFISHVRGNEKLSPEEMENMRGNATRLDSFLQKQRDTTESQPCSGKDCFLYAEVNKSVQQLYLYIAGELKDSFKVSTGIKKYETPEMNTRPAGPVLTKYTSRKFPGGNYMGLGNMPYVVFIRGGYAIHGTTPGNFKKLGTKASHGCIRLHPDNAKVFFELVKLFGLKRTWVCVKDSL